MGRSRFRLWKLLVLDIRPRQEFDAGRLPPAIGLDLNDPDWRKRIFDLAASACAAPSMAPSAALAAAGVRNARSGTGESSKNIATARDSLPTFQALQCGDGVADQQAPPCYSVPSCHICIMASDSSTQQTSLAKYVYNILTQELFLK